MFNNQTNITEKNKQYNGTKGVGRKFSRWGGNGKKDQKLAKNTEK